MTTIHYYLLVNPTSGGGNGQEVCNKICRFLEEKQLSYNVFKTEFAGHEVTLTQQLIQKHLRAWDATKASTFPLLVVIGGDGTLHQVTNEIYHTNKAIPVAYLPAGSGNDFARGLNLSRDPEQSFYHLLQIQEPRLINVINYYEANCEESGLVFNNLGIGLDAAIVQKANESIAKANLQKLHLSSFAYVLAAIKILFQQKGFPILIEYNAQQVGFSKAFLCTTTNHPYFGGGVKIAPSADLAKREFNLVLVERIPMIKILHLILLLIRQKHTSSSNFHQITTDELRIVSTTSQFAQADGEIFSRAPFDFTFKMDTLLFWG